MNSQDKKSIIGIIAGEGDLPAQVMDACKKNGLDFYIVGFLNQTDPSIFPAEKIKFFEPYNVFQIINYLKISKVTQVVLAGKVRRIKFSKLLFDRYGFGLLRIFLKKGISDNSIFDTLVRFFESHGFEVIAANSLVPQILASEGAIGKYLPTDKELKDIIKGYNILKYIGTCDIGQSLVIQAGLVLGVEAAEGTDALIERTASFRQQVRQKPILIKRCKPTQDQRVDLPCIGEQTIKNLVKFDFTGVAIEAQQSIVLNLKTTVGIADQNKLFIYGIGELPLIEELQGQ